jgi:SAM-dependent methyltransferase
VTGRAPLGGIAAAYGCSAEAWADGPSRIYDVLADELVARSPVPLSERLVADLGAGRGAASRAVARVGGRPIALDLAEGMLRATPAAERAPSAVADARALPLATGSVGAVVAAFSLNHLPKPSAGLAEAARVTAPGGAVLVSGYAVDDDHPAKAAVDAAVRAAGWTPDPWVQQVRDDATRLATVDRALAAAHEAGLSQVVAEEVLRPFPDLAPVELVTWRLGMAQVAPFVSALDDAAREDLAADALARLGDPPPLVRRMVVLTAVV